MYGVILDGGKVVNIILDYIYVCFYIRVMMCKELDILIEKVN